MKLRRVKVDRIVVPEVRVRARFDDELMEQFRSSVRELGAIAPIICCYVDSQYVLVDGEHRLNEAKQSGQEYIDVAVIEGDMVDVLTKNIFLDHLRGKTPPSDMVKVLEELKVYGLTDSEKIAEKTGLTRDYIEKLQLISELTPMCRAALDEGRIKLGHAAALTKVKDPVRQETILGQCELYHWRVAELEQFISDVLAIVQKREEAPVVTSPPPLPTIKCFYCKGDFDVSAISNPNTCAVCAGILLELAIQARREEKAPVPPETE